MICSLLAVDRGTRMEPKGCCLLVRWLVHSTNTLLYHWLLGDKTFYGDHECTIMTSSLVFLNV